MSAFKIERILTVRLDFEVPERAFVLSEAAARKMMETIQNPGQSDLIDTTSVDLRVVRRDDTVWITSSGLGTTWKVDATKLFDALKGALEGKS